MENTLSQSFPIRISQCDHSARLGIAAAFDLFMDVATDHSAVLGCGVPELRRRNRVWVAVRSRLRFERRPALGERCRCETWPEPPGRRCSQRNYRLWAGDELLIAGRNEWTILDQGTGELCSLRDGVYPEGLPLRSEQALPGPYHRFVGAFPEEPFAAYMVRSTDVDLAGHMNNVAYVRALLAQFSTAELDARPLRELELNYRAAAYEGQTLLLRRRSCAEGEEYQAALPDGTVILCARAEFG